MNTIFGLSAISQYACFRQARRAIGQHPYYAGALAAIGIIAGVAVYSRSTRNSAEHVAPTRRVVIDRVAAANHLIAFYNALPFEKPQVLGDSPIEQATFIKTWMEGDGNRAILSCGDLDLSRRNLVTLPPEIGLFRNLVSLNLARNQLAALPAEIGQLRALTTLDLSQNQLAALPAEIGQLQALTTLDLFGNQLAALPVEIGQLQALTTLDLFGNQLAALPVEIGHLQALTTLNLSTNRLAALPAEIGHLQALTTLYLSTNRLAALPVEIGHLQALTTLYLSWNQLAALPAEIGQLQALTTLNLFGNRLAALPAEIGHLQALTTLYLSTNRLAALPVEIGQLQALTTLDFSSNQLAVLPAEIGQLQALTTLNLSRNHLAVLPDSLLNLPSNCTIHAHMNPFNPILLGQFQQRLLDHRANNPRQGPNIQVAIRDDRNSGPAETLATRLQGWSQEFAAEFPQNETNAEHWNGRTTDFTPILSLEGDEPDNLNNYLRRLRDTQDYRNPEAKKNLILRVERMVQLACRNPEFKKNVLGLISEGLVSCGDRVLITFNEIEIQWQFHNKPLNDLEFSQLAIRASRYEWLKKYAKKVGEAKGILDQIETILGFHIRLRDALDLPITTQGMLYPGMSGVTEGMLVEATTLARSITDKQWLEESEHWQSRQKALHDLEAKAVNEKFGAMLVAAAEYYGLPHEERSAWLDANSDPELHAILLGKANTNFDAVAKALMAASKIALAKLARDPSSHGVQELSREEKDP